jgi:uncharacterized protein YcfL
MQDQQGLGSRLPSAWRNLTCTLSCILLLSPMLSACQSPAPVVPQPVIVASPPTPDLRSVPNITRDILPSSHVVGTAGEMRVDRLQAITVNGQLTVEASLSNLRGRRDILYYRMRWLDDTGVMLGQYAPWSTEALDGFQSEVITMPSPYPQAQDFRLEIRGHE